MTDINDDNNVEKRYNEFVEELIQYRTNPIKNLTAIKSHFLAIFKTHQPIKLYDFRYGVSKEGRNKLILYIYDFNDRLKVREYFKSGKNTWHCCECNRIGSAHANELYNLFIKYDIVFVKLKHECQPRELSFVMKIQNFYKAGKIVEAVALQKSVLGSEDLYVISTKKSGAVKSEIKPSEPVNEVTSDISLQYAAAENDERNQELEPLTMDEQIIESEEIRLPEVVFAEIIQNLKEYTNEKKFNVIAKEKRILCVLHTHRPIKICDYHYVLNANLRNNRRFIVFEWDDKKKVREYIKISGSKYLWDCSECRRRSIYISLRLIIGIVFVPLNHYCPPRDYDLAIQYQKFLEEGDTTKAFNMKLKVDFTVGQSSVDIFKNVVNVQRFWPLKNANENRKDSESKSKTLTNSKRKLPSTGEDEIASDVEVLSLHKKSKHKKITTDVLMDDTNKADGHEYKDAAKTSKRKMKKENHLDSEPIEEPESIATSSIFAFEKPSTLILEEICTKLEIQYRNRAMKIWDQIMFEQINIVSFPSTTSIETYEFQTENFYEILSKLFTGKSKHHEQIQATILEAFRKKLVESGEITARKFDKRYSKDTVTDRHLSFIAKFLPCRILIFEENGIRKYGKWKETSRKRVTLVLSFFDGIYSIVLNL